MNRKIMVGIFLLWSTLVLAVYYQRLWGLFDLEIRDWITGQSSLTVGMEFLRQLNNGDILLQLPAWNEAIVRAGQGLLGAGLVLLAAQALGWILFNLMLWSPGDPIERMLFRTAVGFGGIAYLSLAMTAYNAYRVERVSEFVGILAAGGLVYAGLRWSRKQAGKLTDPKLPDGKPAEVDRSPTSRPIEWIWKGIAALAATIALIGALAPDIANEAIWYHWLPLQLLDNGRPIQYIQDAASLNLITWDLITGAALSIGGVTAAKLLNYSSFVMILFLIYRLTIRFAPDANPWQAAAFFAAIPSVLWLAASVHVNNGLMLFVGLAVYAILNYFERRERGWLALAILNLGFVLALSFTALFVLMAATIGVAVVSWTFERRLSAFFPAAALAAASITLSFPFYLHSWLYAGSIGILNLPEYLGLRVHPNFVMIDLVALPWNITMNTKPAGVIFGPVILIILPVILVFQKTCRSMVFIFALLSFCSLGWILFFEGEPLHLLPLAPLAAVLASVGFEFLRRSLPGGAMIKNAFQLLTAIILLLNLPPFTSLHLTEQDALQSRNQNVMTRIPLGVVIGYETEEAYLRRKMPSYAVWQYVNENLPPGSRVLTSGAQSSFPSHDKHGDVERISTASTGKQGAGSEEKQAVDRLRILGISHVLVKITPDEYAGSDAGIFFEPYFIEYYFEVLYEDTGYILYEVKNVRLTGVGG
jgi:hypothetical protein